MHLFLILTHQNSISLRGGPDKIWKSTQRFDIAYLSLSSRIQPLAQSWTVSISFLIPYDPEYFQRNCLEGQTESQLM